ncbi:hypothetical protein [Methylobacterium variabile]|jgi:hypothetical protein|uniref:hypothetical protein n=1 Tax=Methylobacterium variabile TaxID=298794 RepID=UPI0012EDE9AE|nr:hypothetical protein [Methylobacterium variabile]
MVRPSRHGRDGPNEEAGMDVAVPISAGQPAGEVARRSAGAHQIARHDLRQPFRVTLLAIRVLDARDA